MAAGSAMDTKRRHWQFWRKPQEAAATNIQAVTPTKSPVALPSATTGHSSESPDDGEQASATSGQAHGQLDAASDTKRRLTPGEKQTIINMSTNGMKAVDIATQMQLNENTVRSTIARASKPTMHTNGAAK
jgi:DNA-directed RNA polymerase specialized sigma24 family protein